MLVDRGLGAKLADVTLPSRRLGGRAAVGTPLWLAPECLAGESGNTPASDVYAFGVLLYEVLRTACGAAALTWKPALRPPRRYSSIPGPSSSSDGSSARFSGQPAAQPP